MAMGIVSDSDFENEVNSVVNRPSTSKKQLPVNIVPFGSGKREGDKNIPTPLRKVIAQSYLSGEANIEQIGRAMNVSNSQVSNHIKGKVKDPELIDHILELKSDLSGKALNKIKLALQHISSDKIENAKLKDIASLAKDMSVVAKNMEPSNNNGININNTNYMIYAPRERKEQSYEVVESLDE